jgi:energy-coupling factor transporter transmembrane protein EcfT
MIAIREAHQLPLYLFPFNNPSIVFLFSITFIVMWCFSLDFVHLIMHLVAIIVLNNDSVILHNSSKVFWYQCNWSECVFFFSPRNGLNIISIPSPSTKFKKKKTMWVPAVKCTIVSLEELIYSLFRFILCISRCLSVK